MSSWKFLAYLVIAFGGGVSMYNTIKSANQIQKIQKEVKTYNLNVKEYEAIKKNIYNKGFTTTAEAAMGWQQALDSLKMDAACKKAYMEGCQMVRDSIKVASKIK